MKKSYYLIVLVLILGLALTGCSLLSDISQVPATEQSGITYLTKHTEDDPYVTKLLAGQTIDVGDVEVWNDGSYLYVKYVVDAEYWCLTETHLHVAELFGDIPQTKKGNPIPGKFDYKSEHDCVTDYTYEIPLDWGEGTPLFIAAHAVVCQLVGNFIAGLNLPDTVNFMVTFPFGGGPAYFPHTYITGLDGSLDVYGWCVDTENVIYENTEYTACIYSSYEKLPDDLIEYPENLDLVNWILNQGFVGDPSACCGIYTYGDVQRAIWELIEDDQSTSGLGPWNPFRVAEILAAAFANGEGFVPGCGDIICVILEPIDGEQIIIGEVVIECGCETAWGEGTRFVEKGNWGMYFEYTIQLHNTITVEE